VNIFPRCLRISLKHTTHFVFKTLKHCTEMADTPEAGAIKMKRTVAKRQFTRAETDLKNALSQTDVPLITMERRFDTLKQRWSEVQNAHDLYVGTIMTDESAEIEEDKWIDEIESRFSEMEIYCDTVIQERNSETRSSKEPPDTKVTPEVKQQTTLLKLERLKFRSFAGDIRKFPQFKEEFMKHIEPQCQASQVALVLRSYLSEEIREEVDSAGDDVGRIWSRLSQKYGNTGKLVDAIVYEVKNLPKTTTNEATIYMINVIEKATRDLERLGQETEMYNATIISHIEERMPTNMKEEWVKIVASSNIGSRKKFELLLKLMEDWRNRLEYMSNAVRSTLPEISSKTHLADSGVNAAGTSTRKVGESKRRMCCWIHEDEPHPVWRCPEFRVMEFQEKMKLVRTNKACELCLEPNCPGVNDVHRCKSGFKCLIRGCEKKHNILLHPPNNEAKGKANHAAGENQEDTARESTILQLQDL